MKKLKKIFAFLLVLVMVATNTAVAVQAAPIVNTKVLDGISFDLATPGGGSYSDTRYWDKTIDGRKAYCVEPGVMDLSSNYDGATIDDERYVRASLADYWGRACQGNSAVSQFYVQIYTWEMLGCSLQNLSDPSGGGRVSLEHYHSWKAGIQPAIDAYFNVPSFAGSTCTIVIRNTETLTDSNGTLGYYSMVGNPTDVKAAQSGNTLNLTAAASARTEGAIEFVYSIDGAYHDLEQYIEQVPVQSEGNGAKPAGSSLPEVDFKALYDINPEIAGWLYSPDTPINYPVVQGQDNTHYLDHLFDGTPNKLGCLFLDAGNAPHFLDNNTVIFGHNMLDQSMFSSLSEYRNQDYYDDHPVMYFLIPWRNYEIQIFSAYEAQVDGDSWTLTFPTDGEYCEWLRSTKERSLFDSEEILTPASPAITLSTCVNGADQRRFVVVGKVVPLQP